MRSRGRCEECGATQGLQWAHGWSRSYRKIRHDLRNGFCLCGACHLRFTHNPILWDDWMRRHLGDEEYTRLRILAIKGPKADLRETVALLQLEYARLGLG